MQPAEVIELVMAAGGRLTVEEGNLRVRAPQSVLTEVRHHLRQHEEAILRLLGGD
jgi:hypothetical protein